MNSCPGHTPKSTRSKTWREDDAYADTNQGLRQPPVDVSLAEEIARLKRYEEYLLDDLRHIRERREVALKILGEQTTCVGERGILAITRRPEGQGSLADQGQPK